MLGFCQRRRQRHPTKQRRTAGVQGLKACSQIVDVRRVVDHDRVDSSNGVAVATKKIDIGSASAAEDRATAAEMKAANFLTSFYLVSAQRER
jgi:hypothetical protein